jgi:hypothetical protein
LYAFMYPGGYCINGIPVRQADIDELLLRDNYLLEEYCQQGEFENNIWPYSVNTIRIISLTYQGVLKVAAAIQRIGMDKTQCVDNACMGGLYADIDIKTGRMSAARSHSKDNLLNSDGTKKLFSHHPVTKSRIQGVVIPEWDSICNYVIGLHRALSFTGIEFIAWDIALTEEGCRVIEANTSCGLDLLQTSGGVRNEMIGKWMKEKGYLREKMRR